MLQYMCYSTCMLGNVVCWVISSPCDVWVFQQGCTTCTYYTLRVHTAYTLLCLLVKLLSLDRFHFSTYMYCWRCPCWQLCNTRDWVGVVFLYRSRNLFKVLFYPLHAGVCTYKCIIILLDIIICIVVNWTLTRHDKHLLEYLHVHDFFS